MTDRRTPSGSARGALFAAWLVTGCGGGAALGGGQGADATAGASHSTTSTDAGTPLDGAATTGGAGGPACSAALIKAEERLFPDEGPSRPRDAGCVVQPAPCVASCELPGCTVVSDMEIKCSTDDLARRGLRVAPSSTETFVVATGDDDTRIFEIRGPADGRELPSTIPQHGLLLAQLVAVGPDDVMHIVGVDDSAGLVDDPTGLGAARVLFATRAGDVWQTEPLATDNGPIATAPTAFEIGSDGVPRVYGRTGTDPTTYSMARRSLDGKWTLDAAQPWSGFTLSPSGAEVFVGEVSANGGEDVEVELGGVVATVGLVENEYRASYGVPQLSSAVVPPMAIAGFRPPGFWLMWPTGATGQEVAIPGTARLQYTCTSPPVSACTGECREQGVGVEQTDVLGLARTADGTAWFGFLTAERDYDIHYAPLSTDTGLLCGGMGLLDLTVGKLHVVRSRLDGAPVVETLNLPIEEAQSGDLEDGVPELDLRGFGRRLAIATRVRDAVGYTKLRVVTLDTGAP